MTRREFPKIHFYDRDLVAVYDETWTLLRDFWKKGNHSNGMHSRYFNHPESDRISQFEACFATFFLVYSNRIFPATSVLDNFYG